jgi:NAD-dependent DNA ligase
MKIKVRALRRKVWFKALSRVERGIIDLTIRCVERIRSHALMKTVLAIVDKLLRTSKEHFLKKVENIGREIAQKICEIAWKWGNLHALIWKYDLNFVRFLGVSALNS